MGRWSQYDEDKYRLPEGMERIGYDADTMRYCFRDRDNSVWQGEEGSEFGPMTRVNRLPSSVTPYHLHYHQQQQRSPTTYEPSFTEPSRPTADSSTSSQRSPTTYEPSFTEPSRPTADSSTSSYWTLFPFSLLSLSSFSFCGIWSSRRDSATKNDPEDILLSPPVTGGNNEKERIVSG